MQLLYASGFLFMGATEEQMLLVANSPMDHVSYILILYSFAFLVFLFVHMIIALYERTLKKDGAVTLNGTTGVGGHEARQLRDAEEFELEGLISDDEDEGKRRRRSDDRGPASPESTLGSNSDRIAR